MRRAHDLVVRPTITIGIFPVAVLVGDFAPTVGVAPNAFLEEQRTFGEFRHMNPYSSWLERWLLLEHVDVGLGMKP